MTTDNLKFITVYYNRKSCLNAYVLPLYEKDSSRSKKVNKVILQLKGGRSFTFHYFSGYNSIKSDMEGFLWQLLLEIYEAAGKRFIILCTSLAAVLPETNYGLES